MPPAGIPRALLGHQVAVVGLRPAFPDFTPYEYRNLAERCWQQDPEQRYVPACVRVCVQVAAAALPCTSLAAFAPCLGPLGRCLWTGAL
jgi:hypothetical protein